MTEPDGSVAAASECNSLDSTVEAAGSHGPPPGSKVIRTPYDRYWDDYFDACGYAVSYLQTGDMSFWDQSNTYLGDGVAELTTLDTYINSLGS
jgi:hypothetical protein